MAFLFFHSKQDLVMTLNLGFAPFTKKHIHASIVSSFDKKLQKSYLKLGKK